MEKAITTLCARRPTVSAQKVEHFALDYTITEISGGVCCLWLDSTNCKLIGKSVNQTLDLWQLKRRQVQLSPTYQLRGYSGKAIAVTMSPDGDKLVCSDTTAKRSYLKIWNLLTGKLEHTLFGHKQIIQSLAISFGDRSATRQRNRPFLASGSHKIKLWNLQTGEPWLTLFGHKKWVYSLAIAPDGQTIVSGSDDQTIKLWELKTGKLLRTLTGHTGSIRTLAISPDCQYLVSGSDDKTLKIWHWETGELRQTLLGHEQTVRTLAIHPNGQTIVSGSDDKTIKFWRII